MMKGFWVLLVIFSLLSGNIFSSEKSFPTSYSLKPGDRMYISVYGEAGADRNIVVDPTGAISYLIVNSLRVQGMNIQELREKLEEKLKGFYRDPLVLITALNFPSQIYTITGDVRNPGVKKFAGFPTVLTALCEGGGLTTRVFRDQTIDQADLDHSFLVRKGKFFPVNFTKLVYEGDMSQNIPLEVGDYIYIAPRYLSKVYIVGEVGAAATVEFLDTLTLSQAIAEARSITRIASSRVVVLRGSLACPERYLIDFNRIMKGCAADFLLEAGDIIFVPSMQYSTLKEIVKVGISSFVSIAASVAGTNAFFAVNPEAAITGVIGPTPVINPGFVVSPAGL